MSGEIIRESMSLSWEFRITRYSAQVPIPYSHTVQEHIFFFHPRSLPIFGIG